MKIGYWNYLLNLHGKWSTEILKIKIINQENKLQTLAAHLLGVPNMNLSIFVPLESELRKCENVNDLLDQSLTNLCKIMV